VLGRPSPHPQPRQPEPAEVELTRLRAAIDQTLALVRERAAAHSSNRDLVDLALDVHNTLKQPTS